MITRQISEESRGGKKITPYDTLFFLHYQYFGTQIKK